MLNMGVNIKKYRKIKGMTQQEVATECNLTQEYICKLEKGKTNNPTTEALLKIAKTLGVSIADLLSSLDEESDNHV